MKQLLVLFSILLYTSCIPLRIAPTIKTDKVMVAKKFKRKLPKHYAFIFEDPKDANEFYNYINTKYELDHKEVEWNVPFELNNEGFCFSFYEIEKIDKTLNLLPIFIDAALQSNDSNPMLEEVYTSRKGNWYLAITVSNDALLDCLNPEYKQREVILKYLRDLKEEYLNTSNYFEALLKK
ncbi:MAG: hypothetical protein ACI9OE_000779 [Mariniflexile sp.]|jgi:hypothetical protein